MAPESLRTTAVRAVVTVAALIALAAPAHALRLLDYNVLNYPGGSAWKRDPHFRTILQSLHPDILVAEEMASQAGVDSLLHDVLDVIEPGQWAALPFANGNDTDAALFYRTSVIAPPTQLSFYPNSGNLLRLVHEYVVHPVGYTSQASELRLYAVHLKSSTGSANVAQRLAEATGLRDSMNAMPPGTHMIGLGDFNFYSGKEPGLGKLLESQGNDTGRLYDPLGLAGYQWQDSAGIAMIHTQSPCLSGGAACASGAATGGLDDRFDLILPTLNWANGTGYELLANTYVSVGNDGLHLNKNITDPPTIPEGAAYAQALILCSDHLPLRVDFSVPALSQVASALDLGTVIGGGAADLAVANVAVPPADGLTYTLTAPSGFAAPGGTLETAPGATSLRTVATTPGGFGPRAGNLVLASDDLDRPAQAIALSANVLDHAHASLDSTVEQTSGALAFGTQPAGSFTTVPVAAHDFGWNAAQARLALQSAAITGGDGRFSIVSGDPHALVADTGERFGIAFDPSGATADSEYTATLTITGADEPLPGAQAAATLTVALSATVGGTPLATPTDPAAPGEVRLYAPAPNPLATASRVRFDLTRRSTVRVEVLDLSGRRVALLAHRAFEPGRYTVSWTGRDAQDGPVPAGVYFVRMTGDHVPAQAVRLAVVR